MNSNQSLFLLHDFFLSIVDQKAKIQFLLDCWYFVLFPVKFLFNLTWRETPTDAKSILFADPLRIEFCKISKMQIIDQNLSPYDEKYKWNHKQQNNNESAIFFTSDFAFFSLLWPARTPKKRLLCFFNSFS